MVLGFLVVVATARVISQLVGVVGGHMGGVMNRKDSMPVAMDALLSFHVSA